MSSVLIALVLAASEPRDEAPRLPTAPVSVLAQGAEPGAHAELAFDGPAGWMFAPDRPAQSPQPVDEARAAFERAEELARTGRYADARLAYQRVTERFPDSVVAKEAKERSKPSAFLGWADVVRNGPSKNRVDVVLLGDGYELEHLKAFDKLAGDIPPLFERQETFREYYAYFNFLRGACLSADSGVDGFGREYDTALNGHTTGTFAGHVAVDGEVVRRVLGKIPDTDGLAIVFVKTGVLGTGGGGIATIGGREVRTVIHEFGHAFGGLGDEYQTAQSHAQGSGPVHGAPNVSGTEDPKAVPWAHWLAAKHPGVGLYEGASGRPKGAWRPTSTGCVMDSAEAFCVVCREQLVRSIYAIVDPIDACTPEPMKRGSAASLALGEAGLEFKVEVLRPSTHAIEVRWWVLPEGALPKSGEGASRTDDEGVASGGERARRGPLTPIAERPAQEVLANTAGKHAFRLQRSDLKPGRYRVICRAKDATKLRGERFPWVLSDPEGLLESERAWWVEVRESR
ncbi:MAG: hypothetical protein IPJ77_10075 [Planctomycetes bacterium]|nr:hypothetical protein [Planctomycetota bacterium]